MAQCGSKPDCKWVATFTDKELSIEDPICDITPYGDDSILVAGWTGLVKITSSGEKTKIQTPKVPIRSVVCLPDGRIAAICGKPSTKGRGVYIRNPNEQWEILIEEHHFFHIQPRRLAVQGNHLLIFCETGNMLRTISTTREQINNVNLCELTNFVEPSYILSVETDDGEGLVVTCGKSHKVCLLRNGEVVWTKGGDGGGDDGSGNEEGQFNQPHGLCKLGPGKVAIAEWSGRRVTVMSTTDGSHVAHLTERFSIPKYICFTKDGHLWVMDHGGYGNSIHQFKFSFSI